MSALYDGAEVLNYSAGGFEGDGAFTIAVLTNTAASAHGVAGWRDFEETVQMALLQFDGHLFGKADVSNGFGSAVSGWQVWAVTKAAGSAHYRMHKWTYASDGSGSMAHGESTGAADHADFAAASGGGDIQVGAVAGVDATGDIAIVAMWDSVLSDASLDTLKSADLADWAALSPAFGVELSAWDGATGDVVFAGTSVLESETGTVAAGSNPSGFNFSLSEPPGSGSATGTYGYVGTASGTAPEIDPPEETPVTGEGDTYVRSAYRFPRSKVISLVRDAADPTKPTVLFSPDGTAYQLAIANGGAVSTAAATDPPPRWSYNFPRPRFRTSKVLARASRLETPRVVSPNGTIFRLSVANGGALTAVAEFTSPTYRFSRPTFNTSQVMTRTTVPPPVLDASPDATVYRVLVANNGTISSEAYVEG
jgi:hypothetical protein